MKSIAMGNRSRGFTLIEILIAISIIAIALLSVNRLQSQTLVMAQATQFYTLAPILAQSKMADFEEKSGSELADDSGDFGEDYPGYRWQATIEGVKSKPLDQITDDLKQINIRVSYQDNEFEFSIRRYRFMR
jgi:general secretion pathway protein I